MSYITLLSFVLMLAMGACQPGDRSSQEEPVSELNATARTAVEEAIRSLDDMRSGLAGGINSEIVDAGTFAAVCKPVGMQAMNIGSANGWTVRQLAMRYRNLANKADQEAADAFPLFESRTDLDSLWIRTTQDGAPGWRYLRRITVEPACLKCHGAEASRPEFVRTGYPKDKAYDFETGDLRGLYSVFVPDTSLVREAYTVPLPRLAPVAFLNTDISDAVILDVRTPEEFSDGHLGEALNIDFRASDFREKAAQLDRNKVYFLYCRSGNRSEQAGAIMRDLGFRKLYNIGGLSDLDSAGARVIR